MRGDRGYAGSLTGPSLDARALVGRGDAAGKPPEPEGGAVPLDLTVAFDRVVFGEDRHLSAVAGTLRRDARSWTHLDVTARSGRNGTVSLRYRPGAGGFHEVAVLASDAGEALRALDLTDRVRGGTLSIGGRTVEPRADAAIEGALEVTDYALVDPPVLARMLNAISPAGFAAARTSSSAASPPATARRGGC